MPNQIERALRSSILRMHRRETTANLFMLPAQRGRHVPCGNSRPFISLSGFLSLPRQAPGGALQL